MMSAPLAIMVTQKIWLAMRVATTATHVAIAVSAHPATLKTTIASSITKPTDVCLFWVFMSHTQQFALLVVSTATSASMEALV